MADNERRLIASTQSRTYFIPSSIEENRERAKIDLGNVFAGLQWYKAFINSTYKELSQADRVRQLLDIFENPNDLVSLAKIVESQTGVEGLVNAVVESYRWAEWKIKPQLGDVTERLSLVPHIGISLKVGEDPLTAVSARYIKWDGKKKEIVPQPSKFRIFRGADEIECDNDEHGMLPDINLRFVEVLPGNQIAFDGDEFDVDSDKEDPVGPERTFDRYILTSSGQLQFETKERFDRKHAFRHLITEASGVVSHLPHLAATDQEEIVARIEYDSLAKTALANFLLPYCDMPSPSGAHYVLPQEGDY